MSASAKRFYSLIGALVLLIGAVFVYYSWIVPEYVTIQTLRGEEEGAAAKLSQYKSISDSISALLNKYHTLAPIQASFDSILPTGQEEVPTIVNQVQGLAAVNKLNLISLSVQELPIDYSHQAAAINPLGTVRITLHLSGAYSDFKGFLGDLGTNARIFDLNSLNISAGSGTGVNPTFDYTVAVDAYFETTSTPSR